jgi:hypothetical protein
LQTFKSLDKMNRLLMTGEMVDMKNGFPKNKATASSLSLEKTKSTKKSISINKPAASIISSETCANVKINKKKLCTIL